MLRNEPNPGKNERYFFPRREKKSTNIHPGKQAGTTRTLVCFSFVCVPVCVVNNSKNSLKSFDRHIGCLYLCCIQQSRFIVDVAHRSTHIRTFESRPVSPSSTHSALPSVYHSHFRLIIASLYAVREWAKHISVVKPFLHACKYFPIFFLLPLPLLKCALARMCVLHLHSCRL